jgi:glutamate N-acetyltransferase/amino-acid N-acetyltransferase
MSESAIPFEPVAGVRLAAVAAGIRYQNRNDLCLLELSADSQCAAVFTRNAFCAAPVTLARRHLATAPPRYLLINSGNANAGTGAGGLRDAEASCAALATLAGCRSDEVLPFSTGVIGEPLPVARLEKALPSALASLDASAWPQAARAIMTTDTRPKLVSRSFEVAGRPAVVTGIAKGAGMIRPDMATMLAFLATDLAVERNLLQSCLAAAVDVTFNAITIDGDTSTNDACVLAATGALGTPPLHDPDSPDLRSGIRR